MKRILLSIALATGSCSAYTEQDKYQILAADKPVQQLSSLERFMHEALAEANKEFKQIQDLYESGVDRPGQAWFGSTYKKEPGLADIHKKRAIKALKRALEIAKEANLKNEISKIQDKINIAQSL